MMLATTGGITSSHLPALATASTLVSTPSAAHSCRDGPLICAAAGALPETTRDFSTVMAESPPPPATAKSFHVWPCFCRVALSAVAALASPPLVHQCRTSTSPAWAAPAAISAHSAAAWDSCLSFIIGLSPYRLKSLREDLGDRV